VPANNKPFGRLAVFRIVTKRLSASVSLEPRPLDPKTAKAASHLFKETRRNMLKPQWNSR
jgi:hypothetical protein